MLHGCTVSGIPFDFNDEGCVALMEIRAFGGERSEQLPAHAGAFA